MSTESQPAHGEPAHSDLGGVILCGGRSSRMGEPKAWLRFGDETLLQRAVRQLGQVAAPLVVVAAPEQDLPVLPAGVQIARDPVAGRGPLQGIAAGLRALAPQVRRAFVCATDSPFLAPAFVRRMAALAEGHEVAVARVDERNHPLGAIYATALHQPAQALIDAGKRRPFFLFERSDTRWVNRDELLGDDELRRVDPELWSLRNVNTPEELADALADAGLGSPPL